ncbi:MAG: MupA/Atu3671 family FMN-dependent luciferase-like monooxygenase [Tumebacillaceae bacterium]
MKGLNERLANLSPQQRALLEQKLKEKGINTAVVTKDKASDNSMFDFSHIFKSKSANPNRKRRTDKGMDFSIFFFSGDGSTNEEDKYSMLIESAKFADRNGFSAIWTPERHFEDFGGLYPNPSVLSAALAVLTENIQLRAGSVALPLHHPIRFIEEWSVVDNLSRGRVAVALASGWHPTDFIIAPNTSREYYDNRKETLFEHMELIRNVWAGATMKATGIDGNEVEVKVLPKPIQPQIDFWIASNGSPETVKKAGHSGANLLTGYLTGIDEMEEMVALYRASRAEAGHDPETGQVTVMIHTCVGTSDSEIKEKVRGPLRDYLKTFLKQQKHVLPGYDSFSAEDHETIASFAFDRYFEGSGLLGSVDKCSQMVEDLIDIGVNEVACLVDFGISNEDVMNSFTHLLELKEKYTI